MARNAPRPFRFPAPIGTKRHVEQGCRLLVGQLPFAEQIEDRPEHGSCLVLGNRIGTEGGNGSINGLQSQHGNRSEEHTSELQSLMRISYAVVCLNKQIQCITFYTPVIVWYVMTT